MDLKTIKQLYKESDFKVSVIDKYLDDYIERNSSSHFDSTARGKLIVEINYAIYKSVEVYKEEIQYGGDLDKYNQFIKGWINHIRETVDFYRLDFDGQRDLKRLLNYQANAMIITTDYFDIIVRKMAGID